MTTSMMTNNNSLQTKWKFSTLKTCQGLGSHFHLCPEPLRSVPTCGATTACVSSLEEIGLSLSRSRQSNVSSNSLSLVTTPLPPKKKNDEKIIVNHFIIETMHLLVWGRTGEKGFHGWEGRKVFKVFVDIQTLKTF